MPTKDTFSCRPIAAFIDRFVDADCAISVDPFARNSTLATYTNDLNSQTTAASHKDALEFLADLKSAGVSADVVFFDPPYSPRQISEIYSSIGRKVGKNDTQNGAFYRKVRDAIHEITRPGGVVLSFGWNSTGMGRTRGYEIVGILLVNHGAAHNDTICIAERRRAT